MPDPEKSLKPPPLLLLPLPLPLPPRDRVELGDESTGDDMYVVAVCCCSTSKNLFSLSSFGRC
jgi:hypothetical protein